jgi:antitoxin VapB
MRQTAKLFMKGRSQAVLLPTAIRIDATEVFISHDPTNDDVVLSRKPRNWDGFFIAIGSDTPSDFLSASERTQLETLPVSDRDPFVDWIE